ncbi:MAG: ABC transporter permease [Sporichthyaceae bacterium]
MTGRYAPAPGSAAPARMVRAQAMLETRMLLRNGEQLLLTVIIPTLLLVLFSKVDVIEVEGDRIDFMAPGILALAVMSTAFTGQAIATGFERRYGVLKRLGVSPLPRWALLLGKTLSVLAVQAMQVALLVAVAFALGWDPDGNPAAVLLLLVLGTAAFSGLGLLMAGTLRAEATLAAANLVYLVLLLCGGIVIPLEKFGGAEDVLAFSPAAALAEGLRDVLSGVDATPWGAVGILAVWAVASLGAAARFFRWD